LTKFINLKMVQKEKLLLEIDNLINNAKQNYANVSSPAQRGKYNYLKGILQNLFQDIEYGHFD
jgi:hypothetical protein